MDTKGLGHIRRPQVDFLLEGLLFRTGKKATAGYTEATQKPGWFRNQNPTKESLVLLLMGCAIPGTGLPSFRPVGRWPGVVVVVGFPLSCLEGVLSRKEIS